MGPFAWLFLSFQGQEALPTVVHHSATDWTPNLITWAGMVVMAALYAWRKWVDDQHDREEAKTALLAEQARAAQLANIERQQQVNAQQVRVAAVHAQEASVRADAAATVGQQTAAKIDEASAKLEVIQHTASAVASNLEVVTNLAARRPGT